MYSRFDSVFENKPIIGVLHMQGPDAVRRALDESKIYEDNGVNALLLENYNGGKIYDIEETIIALHNFIEIPVGVNILPNEYMTAFEMARRLDLDFIQLDHVAGTYTNGSLDDERFMRNRPENLVILGGVWPKYYKTIYEESDENLFSDLVDGMVRSDAIVITGTATGVETPIEKIKKFYIKANGFPLVVGAGTTPENIEESLKYCSAAIVGSYFKKDGVDINPVDPNRVKKYMETVQQIRNKLFD